MLTTTACLGLKRPTTPTPAEPDASLWIEPANLADRDLYYGPWGKESAPKPDAVYTLVERKHEGVNLVHLRVRIGIHHGVYLDLAGVIADKTHRLLRCSDTLRQTCLRERLALDYQTA